MNDDVLHAQQTVRAHRRRQDGADYKLRVIPNSGGMLELVEQRPQQHWFVEWARAMQLSGWGY
ncbi:MAG: hypothetical protein AAF529_04240 [Pseudomonadota bacterium]